jgi:adenosylmethionine-8-amino-7-oxononanoate aminotransferase
MNASTGVDHLLLHFTYNDEDWGALPVIVSGDGCRVTDSAGRVYLDGLAGLYTTQVGHGRGEIADAVARQIRQLEYYPNWSLQHPRSLELSAKLAELAPGELSSSFFVSSGSEAIEAMLKIVRQYHGGGERPRRYKFIARQVAYHGTTMGALSLTGLPSIKTAFEPLLDGFIHVPNTRQEPDYAAEAIAETIEREGADTVAAVVLEPVQNAGGCLVPPDGYWPRVREICDQHGVLLVADSTICGFGRLGTWFGTERFEAVPDVITFAKGLTSGYIPMGGLQIGRRVRAALDEQPMFLHGATFGGHPVAAAAALASIAIIERERLLDNVLALEAHFGEQLRRIAAEQAIVSDVRGMGFFWSIEMHPAWGDGTPLGEEEYRRTFKQYLFQRLIELGLLCRVDDRDSPMVILAPPLTADRETIDAMIAIVAEAVGDLARRLRY